MYTISKPFTLWLLNKIGYLCQVWEKDNTCLCKKWSVFSILEIQANKVIKSSANNINKFLSYRAKYIFFFLFTNFIFSVDNTNQIYVLTWPLSRHSRAPACFVEQFSTIQLSFLCRDNLNTSIIIIDNNWVNDCILSGYIIFVFLSSTNECVKWNCRKRIVQQYLSSKRDLQKGLNDQTWMSRVLSRLVVSNWMQ